MNFKISVELSHVCPLAEITNHAAALESYGFFRVWVPDTIISPWEAWLAANLISLHTRRLNIGLGVTNPYTRHPLVVAQMAATLQHLCGGRLALSIGKGIPRLLEKAGIDQHESGVEECITALRDLIAGKRTHLKGLAFQIDGIRIRTIPPPKNIPIYLAAISPSSWETAKQVADGVATIWNEETAKIHDGMKTDNQLPTAALIPFSLSKEDFFEGWNRTRTVPELEDCVEKMQNAGLEEVIIAYRDLADIEAAACLIQ
jgi:alkanesulfonate monooxygenase SsuD/methylene tetrahydromethanopterin reductase-like flavin-dependent oxidoreductase (luciferase family)